MWEPDLPPETAALRQGDLLGPLIFPKFGEVTMIAEPEPAISADWEVGCQAVVLDQCCTIEQKNIVLLGRVGRTKPLRPRDAEYLSKLQQTNPTEKPFIKYDFLLDPHPALAPGKDRRNIVLLMRRVALSGNATMESLQQLRVARMNPLGRAHLRANLTVFFSQPEGADAAWLSKRGLDAYGQKPE